MKIRTIMAKIQIADLTLATIEPLEEYAFAIDISDAMSNIGKYSKMYYERCEQDGMTYEESVEQLGDFLRTNLGYVKNEDIVDIEV